MEKFQSPAERLIEVCLKAIVAEGLQPALDGSTIDVKELLNFGDHVVEILASYIIPPCQSLLQQRAVILALGLRGWLYEFTYPFQSISGYQGETSINCGTGELIVRMTGNVWREIKF